MNPTQLQKQTEQLETWRRRALLFRDRASRVLELHRPPKRGGHRCTECGFTWPCRTYLLLNPDGTAK